MEDALLTVGNAYAFREKRCSQAPMLKVTLPAKGRLGGKVTIRHGDGQRWLWANRRLRLP